MAIFRELNKFVFLTQDEFDTTYLIHIYTCDSLIPPWILTFSNRTYRSIQSYTSVKPVLNKSYPDYGEVNPLKNV